MSHLTWVQRFIMAAAVADAAFYASLAAAGAIALGKYLLGRKDDLDNTVLQGAEDLLLNNEEIEQVSINQRLFIKDHGRGSALPRVREVTKEMHAMVAAPFAEDESQLAKTVRETEFTVQIPICGGVYCLYNGVDRVEEEEDPERTYTWEEATQLDYATGRKKMAAFFEAQKPYSQSKHLKALERLDKFFATRNDGIVDKSGRYRYSRGIWSRVPEDGGVKDPETTCTTTGSDPDPTDQASGDADESAPRTPTHD